MCGIAGAVEFETGQSPRWMGYSGWLGSSPIGVPMSRGAISLDPWDWFIGG